MEYYSEKTVEFLWNLRLNNNKEWFLAHKQDYETLMLAPTKALANAMFEYMRDKYPKYDWKLHISRIYRDARRLFGRGPMNDHLWFTVYTDKAVHPAFYFGFEPEGFDYGLGCWSEGNVMQERFRRQISVDPKPAEKLARRFQTQDEFTVWGEPYKKPKYTAPPLLQDWVNRKNIGFHSQNLHPDGFGPELYDRLCAAYDWLMPYYVYFSTLPQLEEMTNE